MSRADQFGGYSSATTALAAERDDQAAMVADLMARIDAAEAELERWRASARLGWRTARSRMRLADELQERLMRLRVLGESHGPAPHRALCHRCAPLLRDALAGQP